MLKWSRARLRLVLSIFFLTLLLPTVALILTAYDQLRWESFLQYQQRAAELTEGISRQLATLVQTEEQRSFADYSFLVVSDGEQAQLLRPSPLAAWPPQSSLPGQLGYFQVNPDGRLSTPHYPQSGTPVERFGVGPQEQQARATLHAQIERILTENRLISGGDELVLHDSRLPAAPSASASMSIPQDDESAGILAEEAEIEEGDALQGDDATLFRESTVQNAGRAALAKQSLGRVDELKLDLRYQRQQRDRTAPQQSELAMSSDNAASMPKAARKERRAVAESAAVAAAAVPAEPLEHGSGDDLRIRIFESEVGPFRLSLLESGHFVLFRDVWRDQQRFVQGLLVERDLMLQSLVQLALQASALSSVSDVVVAWQGDVLALYGGAAARSGYRSADELQGALLYRSRLSAPFEEMELVFSVTDLPAGPGARLVNWLALIVALILCGGFWLMYRLAVRQMAVAAQQQEFVSAVSHELKTPLTSIRMYAEMLREGWAAEDKRRSYYEFIHDESERLSRLISNVLQLARMTRQELKLEPQSMSCTELLEQAEKTLGSQVARAGFSLDISCDPGIGSRDIQVDSDAFCQILINLVDNALKFSADAAIRRIDIRASAGNDARIVFAVRDYGPGIPPDQMKKIFRLFYRPDSSLTRESAGTGIGLALVRQLAEAMGGNVDVVNRKPGAEFRLLL